MQINVYYRFVKILTERRLDSRSANYNAYKIAFVLISCQSADIYGVTRRQLKKKKYFNIFFWTIHRC